MESETRGDRSILTCHFQCSQFTCPRYQSEGPKFRVKGSMVSPLDESPGTGVRDPGRCSYTKTVGGVKIRPPEKRLQSHPVRVGCRRETDVRPLNRTFTASRERGSNCLETSYTKWGRGLKGGSSRRLNLCGGEETGEGGRGGPPGT